METIHVLMDFYGIIPISVIFSVLFCSDEGRKSDKFLLT